jgi:hypothetical protein
MERSIGYIKTVTNPLPFYGGKDAESEEQTIRRHTQAFKLRDRALATRDYEQLLLQVFPQLAACTCTTGKGGTVILTVIEKDREHPRGEAMLDTQFEQLSAAIRQFLNPRIPLFLQGTDRLLIREAYPIYACAFMDVVIDPSANPYQIKKEIDHVMEQNLGVGLGIGVLPGKMLLTSQLSQISGIVALPKLLLRYEKCVGHGEKRFFVEENALLQNPFFQIRSGEHEITFI